MGKIKVENGVLIFCVVSILAQASLILSASGKLPPQIPIFYSKPWGEPMLGPPIALWILPAISTVSSLVNFSLATFLFKETGFLTRTLFITTFIINSMTLYDTGKIISLLT
ncbi:hypothetical protein A3D81_01505 [Candidatus Curtissbacteria bacterium RIFCSPHIGHO2_02_FULL_40_17]|uniref:DUF1648 domain-containing protein n=3 Tax=Candidatus Curtissiibacteriota TaxID=1752717 RepID=A0A1F5GIZ5_9BACT|nr:MAG: hypothetical protein A2693_01115 [Candidatus Curtissbacteria bacterium RIFCSPHIGHO2_01_FULL_40_12]OGD91794.1 MAG: hypothetical protein A3D81_01505 [Candidatus Curtissbacteria bacterium RIFCSPHIGHO2_02_FULL_40_17]OGE03372.1 MAG: hypothetical protein A3F45_03695 [Candidatus Curtissbacteria bacterium RIFCSPHIGHO2_12_FULL_41_17]